MARRLQAQVVECFHLAFLSVLPREFDATGFVLKGGANLRYFFGSERYSEDIDLDVLRLRDWQVREKVNRTLESQALAITLRAGGLKVESFTLPRQTATTQRWKVAVDAASELPLVRTRIEFSHRTVDQRRSVDPVPESVVADYGIRPPLIQHYRAEAAIEQKVAALAGRSETQARDVFDLELLFRRTKRGAGAASAATVETAADRALELPFEAYRDQVLPFLEPELAELYGSPKMWERIQTYVAGRLEAGSGDS